MYLVQIFLPKPSPEDSAYEDEHRKVREILINKFDGLTEYDKAPASGYWKKDAATKVMRDQMIIYEVQCVEVNAAWWHDFRLKLEKDFHQAEVLIRSQLIQIL
jgi:inorganic pyrophosphatase